MLTGAQGVRRSHTSRSEQSRFVECVEETCVTHSDTRPKPPDRLTDRDGTVRASIRVRGRGGRGISGRGTLYFEGSWRCLCRCPSTCSKKKQVNPSSHARARATHLLGRWRQDIVKWRIPNKRTVQTCTDNGQMAVGRPQAARGPERRSIRHRSKLQNKPSFNF